MLRRLPPLENIGGGLLVWRLSEVDLARAADEPPGELVPWLSLSPSMRRHQQRQLDTLLRLVEEQSALLSLPHRPPRLELPDAATRPVTGRNRRKRAALKSIDSNLEM